MNLQEYQAKKVLQKYDVDILKGYVVSQKEDIEAAARKIETQKAVIKAQVLAGGRGKAGGIKLVSSLTEAICEGEKMLGHRLVTAQTGKEGLPITQIYVEEACEIEKEYYFSILFDRSQGKINLVFSKEGGMEIEEVAKKTPEKIGKEEIDLLLGVADFQLRRILAFLDIKKEAQEAMKKTIRGLYRCYLEEDCTLIEINPLVLTQEDKIIALDAKMSLDENARYRHQDVFTEEMGEDMDTKEKFAKEKGLSYVSLKGKIGCMVNGAGLAMATMDAIHLNGGSAANFLDVGGSADEESVQDALKIILSDTGVKVIFINIFGGIMQCDTIANALVSLNQEMYIDVPIVIRLQGANEKEAKDLMKASSLSVHFADDMDAGAKLCVGLCEGGM